MWTFHTVWTSVWKSDRLKLTLQTSRELLVSLTGFSVTCSSESTEKVKQVFVLLVCFILDTTSGTIG